MKKQKGCRRHKNLSLHPPPKLCGKYKPCIQRRRAASNRSLARRGCPRLTAWRRSPHRHLQRRRGASRQQQRCQQQQLLQWTLQLLLQWTMLQHLLCLQLLNCPQGLQSVFPQPRQMAPPLQLLWLQQPWWMLQPRLLQWTLQQLLHCLQLQSSPQGLQCHFLQHPWLKQLQQVLQHLLMVLQQLL